MTRQLVERRAFSAAIHETRRALVEYDDALAWLSRPDALQGGPLAAEVWVFDRSLAQILLVEHRRRGWVPPGGKVEPGETQREAALRELHEETGVRAELLDRPAAATVRSYRSGWSATMGVSFIAVIDRDTPLAPEDGQSAAWMRVDRPWQGWFPEDRERMQQCARWLAERPGPGAARRGGR